VTAEPVVVAVDDDPTARQRLEGELTKRYGADYQVICIGSPDEAMQVLEDLREGGRAVSLVLADHWMPQMTGTELLVRAHRLHPTAKRVLLIAWGDRATAEPILQATSLGQIDAFAAKPTTVPDEQFHRTVTELLAEWARTHLRGFEAVMVVDREVTARSHEIGDMLARNGIPFGLYPAHDRRGRQLLETHGTGPADLPLVVLFDGRTLANPSNTQIVEALGVDIEPDAECYDLAVIGAGPAGLAAAVYGASEGLSTVVVEATALGGQAGTSSRIRNYLGFPTGLGGADLATRAYQQAWLFGAHFIYGTAVDLRAGQSDRVVRLADGAEFRARAVIVATGVSYRRLGIPGLERLSGAGVFYGAAGSAAKAMKGRDVYIVGAANSAGQAAIHLATYATRVTILARGGSLADGMSDYLVRLIDNTGNIAVRLGAEIVDAHGDGQLDGLSIRDRTSGAVETVPAAALFVLIGAEPHTDWLPEEIVRDRQGFILTGNDLLIGAEPAADWPLTRPPTALETSLPGVYAVGDVRHGSVKRVASAVGEGSIAIHDVHGYLNAPR
jgi:thioredoxin reductase (NADPH)